MSNASPPSAAGPTGRCRSALRRRYAAERRFRLLGLAAIGAVGRLPRLPAGHHGVEGAGRLHADRGQAADRFPAVRPDPRPGGAAGSGGRASRSPAPASKASSSRPRSRQFGEGGGRTVRRRQRARARRAADRRSRRCCRASAELWLPCRRRPTSPPRATATRRSRSWSRARPRRVKRASTPAS